MLTKIILNSPVKLELKLINNLPYRWIPIINFCHISLFPVLIKNVAGANWGILMSSLFLF